MTEIIERPTGTSEGEIQGRHRREIRDVAPATVWIPETWGWDEPTDIAAEKPLLIPTQSARADGDRKDGRRTARPRRRKPVPTIPTTAEWNASKALRRSVALAMLWLVALIGIGVGYAVSKGTAGGLVLPVLPAVVAAGLWACLLMTTPTVVTLRSSVLTVRTRGTTRTFDLASAGLVVTMTENARGGAWRLRLDDGVAEPVVLDGNQVPPAEIGPVVNHYQAIAEHRRRERDADYLR